MESTGPIAATVKDVTVKNPLIAYCQNLSHFSMSQYFKYSKYPASVQTTISEASEVLKWSLQRRKASEAPDWQIRIAVEGVRPQGKGDEWTLTVTRKQV